MRRPLCRLEHAVLLGLATGARTAAGSRCRGGWCLRRCSAASRISRSPGRNTSTSPGPPSRHSSSTASAMASFEVVVAALLERPAALLHREQPARHLDHRRRPVRCEVLREAIGVDRGRGDDHLQVGPARQELPQVAEQEVDVQAALVRLVDDQRVVGAQQRVGLRLGQQDAVGHQLDVGAGLQPVLEAHLEADHLAERRLQLLRDALGHAARRRCAAAGCGRSARCRRRPGRGRAASAIFGSCVVLPEPVSPQTMTTWCARSACAISSRRGETGSDSGKVIGGTRVGRGRARRRGFDGAVHEARIMVAGPVARTRSLRHNPDVSERSPP